MARLPVVGTVSLASLATVAPAAALARYDQVARILVDISYAGSGQPFYLDLELTRYAADDWSGDVPLLPRNVQLRFAARALDASGTVAFSGETLATLAIDNQSVQIPLVAAQDGGTYQLPRMYRIVYPSELYAGQEEPVIFTIEGNAGAAIAYAITPAGSATPSPAFSPAAGTVTLTNTVADVMALYTPPAVTVETSFDYQVMITAADAQSAVAITTSFRAVVKPRPPGGAIVTGTQPSVLWNPVILSMTGAAAARGMSRPPRECPVQRCSPDLVTHPETRLTPIARMPARAAAPSPGGTTEPSSCVASDAGLSSSRKLLGDVDPAGASIAAPAADLARSAASAPARGRPGRRAARASQIANRSESAMSGHWAIHCPWSKISRRSASGAPSRRRTSTRRDHARRDA